MLSSTRDNLNQIQMLSFPKLTKPTSLSKMEFNENFMKTKQQKWLKLKGIPKKDKDVP